MSVGLAGGVGLSAEVCGGGAGLGEVAGEDGVEEGAEDDLGAASGVLVLLLRGVGREERSLPSLGEGHPEDEDELEGVVEGWGRISAALRAGYLGDLRNQ